MLFGCPPPPAPNLWKLEKKFLLYKSISHLIFSINFFFVVENFDPLEIFFKLLLSTC